MKRVAATLAVFLCGMVFNHALNSARATAAPDSTQEFIEALQSEEGRAALKYTIETYESIDLRAVNVNALTVEEKAGIRLDGTSYFDHYVPSGIGNPAGDGAGNLYEWQQDMLIRDMRGALVNSGIMVEQ